MIYITQQSMFVGELEVILSDNCAPDERLQYFIEKYEPQILRKILGQKFFNSLQTELNSGLTGEWAVLVNGGDFSIDGVTYQFEGLKNITAGFIYYWYHRDNAYNVAQTGGTLPMRKEATNKSMAFKQFTAWNKAVELIDCGDYSLYSFLENSSLEDYEVNLYGLKIKGLQWL
tara:strand:- start:742 stop:1260 length:519 start_codon:yes stop_codon:yes gene_type:complete